MFRGKSWSFWGLNQLRWSNWKKINNNIDDLDTTILLMHDFVAQLIGAYMLIYPGLPKTIKRSRGRGGWGLASTPQFLLAKNFYLLTNCKTLLHNCYSETNTSSNIN